MHIVGGIYRERCVSPPWDQIFGSAGRAACLVSAIFSHKVVLSGWFSKKGLAALEASFAPYALDLNIEVGNSHYVFEYAHPLATPTYYEEGSSRPRKIPQVKDHVVLLFGALEGLPFVSTNKLVVDPQGENLLNVLKSNRISAKKIVIVANEQEVTLEDKLDLQKNVRMIFAGHRYVVAVIVKRGPFGALVFKRTGRAQRVRAHYAHRVFKIGSGDVFSAAFAFMWAIRRKNILLSAEFASRTTAMYLNDPCLNFSEIDISKTAPLIVRRKFAQIYLAGPFFTLADILLLAEARSALTNLGVEVFSPLHHVGKGEQARVAAEDLRGLLKSQCVLALLHSSDPGTLFEIGYARAQNIPVVALCEQTKESDLTMLAGTGCSVDTDFCSAIHKSVWAALGRR